MRGEPRWPRCFHRITELNLDLLFHAAPGYRKAYVGQNGAAMVECFDGEVFDQRLRQPANCLLGRI